MRGTPPFLLGAVIYSNNLKFVGRTRKDRTWESNFKEIATKQITLSNSSLYAVITINIIMGVSARCIKALKYPKFGFKDCNRVGSIRVENTSSLEIF